MNHVISVLFGEQQYTLSTPDEDAAIDAFNDRLPSAGHWVYANGLASPEASTVIDNRGEKPIITDGPFVETKEWAAGLWIIDAPDLDVAPWRPRGPRPATARSRCGPATPDRRSGGEQEVGHQLLGR